MHLEIWCTKCRSFCRVWICYNAMLANHIGGHKALQWRHNGRDSVSNHQPRECLLSRLIRRRSKKTSKFRVTDLCAGNSPGPVNSPHKWQVTRKMFPFDDVIMGNAERPAEVSTGWHACLWMYLHIPQKLFGILCESHYEYECSQL